ncbi:MAG: hypothetical protein FJY10_01180 [Bacteroidetes bacterium]|nr:hypothetical protein [Bacteroidota bacterium]
MKNVYQILVRVIIVLLAMIIPLFFYGQTTEKSAKKGWQKAPSHTFWYVGGFGGVSAFHGDLSETKVLPNKDTWGYNYGFNLGRQFTRVMGLRLQVEHGRVNGRVENKFVDQNYISQKFRAFPLEANLNVTVNFVNWAAGYKPSRLFSIYGIFGGGFDWMIGHKTDLLTNRTIANLATYKGPDKKILFWKTDGRGRTSTPKLLAGLGFDFNLSKHWGVNFEYNYKYQFYDRLDMTEGGSSEVINDMYSAATVGVAYKFGYPCNTKIMEKEFGKVKFETTPAILKAECDTIPFSVKITFPANYFNANVCMFLEPVLKYQGGEYVCKPMAFQGENVSGGGITVPYKEGGTYTYKGVIPFKPGMENCMLVAEPMIYCSKGEVYMKKDDVKTKVTFTQLPLVNLAPGVIVTSRKLVNDQKTIIPPHGYVKEVIITKVANLYFPKDIYKLNLKFGLNKTQKAIDDLNQLYDFIQKYYPVNKLTINGWASPEGEETHNVGLSDNRAKAGRTHMNDIFKKWAKSKDPNIKVKIDNPETVVNYALTANGPDWSGFMKLLEASNVKDKAKIMNVINSAGTPAAKEREIRNMILIYPELEADLLPPSRKAEIVATAYEPRKTDEQILQLSLNNPSELTVEEILYAGTLTTNENNLLTIYENAAKTFPTNWKALNNAGVYELKNKKLDKAATFLNKANEVAPNNGVILNNLGALAAANNDYKTAESYFTKAQQLGENVNYNQGTCAIVKCDFQKANTLFAGSQCTYNIALAQFMANNYSAATNTLKCAPQTAETYYLAAVIGARTNNTTMLYENLMNAIKQNPAMKEKAKLDREFFNFEKTPEFQGIVK